MHAAVNGNLNDSVSVLSCFPQLAAVSSRSGEHDRMGLKRAEIGMSLKRCQKCCVHHSISEASRGGSDVVFPLDVLPQMCCML